MSEVLLKCLREEARLVETNGVTLFVKTGEEENSIETHYRHVVLQFQGIVFVDKAQALCKCFDSDSEFLQWKSAFCKALLDQIKELDEYFKKNKYGKLGFNKTNMISNIENNNFESAELHYLSDYYNINTIVLDYYKFIYYRGDNYDSNNNNIIIIKYNDIYLPLIHIFGEHPDNLIYKCIVNKLKINNLKKKKISSEAEAETNTGEEEEAEADTNVKVELKLKSVSAYKLNDLQKLAEEHNIPITHGGKKQTKQQLYNKLKEI